MIREKDLEITLDNIEEKRDWYVEKHREMWNWIYSFQKEHTLSPGSIGFAKHEYIRKNSYVGLRSNCFLCEYSERVDELMGYEGRCIYCPLHDVELNEKGCLNGLYKDTAEDIEVSKQISELPIINQRGVINDC